MAEEKEEKSNFLVVFATVSIAAIILVLVLKGRETEHLTNPGAGTTLEGNASALHEAKRFKNDNTGSLE
ncbi:MAG: hypothetical protein KAH20_02100 [Methylococcales bacterium]|nr:hypothetical protein [Methylococcales bacterium]